MVGVAVNPLALAEHRSPTGGCARALSEHCRIDGNASCAAPRWGEEHREPGSFCPANVVPRPSVNTWHVRVPSVLGLAAHSWPRLPCGWETPQWRYADTAGYRGLLAIALLSLARRTRCALVFILQTWSISGTRRTVFFIGLELHKLIVADSGTFGF